ncbi:hypothetical protein MPLB_250099 [Mesorhizobium sp. ORS 3324]|nr:hypothetical protein MPLB_250099 [Mesorhizobium sp. ORS 3324]
MRGRGWWQAFFLERSHSVPPPSVLPDISPARGEIGCRARFRKSPTLQQGRRRLSRQSPPLRGRCPAGQRGV